MTNAREEILRRIRAALDAAPVDALPDAAPARPANTTPRAGGGLGQFVEEASALAAEVIRVESAQAAALRVAALCEERGWREALAWGWEEIGVAGLEAALAGAGVEVHHGGDPHALEPVPVGITGAEAAITDTGTIVLRSGAGRSPLASLLPPVHVALVDGTRVFPEMRAYLESLGDAAGHARAGSNLVFISGPSRTADIEQTLTLGVHGPRELIIVVYGGN